MNRFFSEGLYLKDKQGELSDLIFMDKFQQDEWLDWLNKTVNLIDDFNKNIKLLADYEDCHEG